MNIKNKRGVSPVIATILLVAIVIIIAVIVFIWLRGFLQEPITKFGNENIELACDKVSLAGELSGIDKTMLEISNNGNVPVEKVKLKLVMGGDYESYTTGSRLKAGRTLTINQEDLKKAEGTGGIEFKFYEKIIIIPVLLGKTSSGEEKEYVCPDKNSKEVYV